MKHKVGQSKFSKMKYSERFDLGFWILHVPCLALSSLNSRATSSNLVPSRSFVSASSLRECFSHKMCRTLMALAGLSLDLSESLESLDLDDESLLLESLAFVSLALVSLALLAPFFLFAFAGAIV